MLGINKIILMGTVGRDPETRYVAKGVSFSRFSLCTDDIATLPDGRMVEQAEWHEVVACRQLSDYAAQNVRKGDAAYVSGKLKSRYVSKGEGGHRVYEVIADEVRVLARSKSNAALPNDTAQGQDPEPPVGSGLPGFDIENLPAGIKGDGDTLPF